MPVVLRSSQTRQEFKEDQQPEPEPSVDSDYEIQSSSDSELNESDPDKDKYVASKFSDDDMQNAVEQGRAKRRRRIRENEVVDQDDVPLEARLRGRPRTELYGKNGFVWDTQQADRRSDRMSDPPADNEYDADVAGLATDLDEIGALWDLLISSEIIKLQSREN